MDEDSQRGYTFEETVQNMMEPKRRCSLKEWRPHRRIEIEALVRAKNDEKPSTSGALKVISAAKWNLAMRKVANTLQQMIAVMNYRARRASE